MKYCFLLLWLLSFCNPCNGEHTKTTPANPYIAIIDSNTGSGTGFLMIDQGEIWLYTNEHVIRGGRPLSARLLTGESLSLGRLQISDDRDAARFKVEGKDEALRLIATQPAIGDPIKIFGNSGGAGVGTYMGGRILGVGPIDIEVSAPIVPGNSGSPIIVIDKGVVGIAAYLINGELNSDWTTQGTRFSQVRRFGVRVDNATWTEVDIRKYFKEASVIRSARNFCALLEKACFDKSWLIDADSRMHMRHNINNPSMQLWIQKIHRIDKEIRDLFNKMCEAKEIAEGKDGVVYNNGVEKHLQMKRFERKCVTLSLDIDRKIDMAYSVRAKALKDTYYQMKRFNFSIPRLREPASLYANRLRRMYNDYLDMHHKELYQMNKL